MSIERDLEGWTIAFDLDGTLVDSAPDLVGTLNRLLVEEGLPMVAPASASTLIGSGARALLVHGFEAAGADVERARSDALFERFLADYTAHIADGSRPFEGVAETLDRLKARGARLVVATNKRSDLSELLLRKLDLIDRFEAVVGWRIERVEHRWAGLRSFAPDRLPVYGFDPARARFFWFAGQGGFGIQTAPAAAELALRLILGKERGPVDPAPYDPRRFF